MANMQNNDIENVFGSKDDSLDVLAAIREIEQESQANDESVKEEPIKDDTPVTPLAQMIENNKKNTQGMIISNKDLEDGAIKAPTKDIVHGTREEEFNSAQDTIDDSIRRRKAVIMIKAPMTQYEHMQMMSEIEAVRFNADGSAFFDIGSEGSDGEDSTGTITHQPVFVRIRTKDDPPYSDDELANSYKIDGPSQKVVEKTEEEKSVEIAKSSNDEDSTETNTDDSNDETESEPDGFALSDKDKKNIEVIIDKTGLGIDFQFSEEERAKLRSANEIVVKQVKTVDIKNYIGKRSTKSFQDYISDYNYNNERVTICFPASGFRAQMRGMSYGEYQDIALSMETVTTDTYHKRLSVIYNCMTNVSTGPFESFDDFLNRFAYSDMPLALYGIFVATESETQEIELKCNVPDCNTFFNWKYNTRSVLRLDRSPAVALEKMKELAAAKASENTAIRDRAIVNASNYIELSESKYIVEIGLASCHDFLDKIVPLLDNDHYKEVFGEDLSETSLTNVLLLTGIRSIRVPADDGYIVCEDAKDILDALYYITPEEIRIVATYVGQVENDYTMVFSFGDVRCPKCGNLTRNMVISIDDLVFRTFQTSMGTTVKLEITQNS